MHYISYMIASFIALIVSTNTVTVTKEVVLKDPNGFITNDIVKLEQVIKPDNYVVGDSIESVAYRQGQVDVLSYITDKLIAKRGM